MTANDFAIQYCYMTIEGLDGKFVVAKLRRVSSPPVQVGSVSDSTASALGRLMDIIRLGKESRNFADLKSIEWLLREQFDTTPDDEWTAYEQVACRVLAIERLEAFPLPPTGTSILSVIFHEAEMNDLPYLVARTGSIMGSPAPFYLTYPRHKQSALARLHDVFRIGVRGQAFRDFVDMGRRFGKKDADIVREWNREAADEQQSG